MSKATPYKARQSERVSKDKAKLSEIMAEVSFKNSKFQI